MAVMAAISISLILKTIRSNTFMFSQLDIS
jgi:hypothetical protein